MLLPVDSGETAEPGDPAEVNGGVIGRAPWMGVAWEDMAEEMSQRVGREKDGGTQEGAQQMWWNTWEEKMDRRDSLNWL